MADEKPYPTPESEDESFWDLDSQGVDDILSENAEEARESHSHAEEAPLAEHPAEMSTFPDLSNEEEQGDEDPEQQDSAAPLEPVPTAPKEKVSAGERMAQLIVLLGLLGVAVWLVTYLMTHFDTSEKRDYIANTPVEGEHASITKIDSWWQAPSSSAATLSSKLVPAAEIHLDPSSTKSGSLRVVFYSMEKNVDGSAKSAGDSITLTFENGKFTNGSSAIKVVGTDGMAEMGDFYAYRNQDEKRWTIEVREATGDNALANDYKPLAKAPIEPLIRE